jgi:5-hydroxyisourate hydrolase
VAQAPGHPRPTISTHVLDLGRGAPAAGVRIGVAWRPDDGAWQNLGDRTTDDDGRVRDLLEGFELQPGSYELTCELSDVRPVGPETAAFFAQASVVFDVSDTSRSYHVPFLVSPFGLSTYRGS